MKYVFEPDILHQIAQEGANLADENRFECIRQRLSEHYLGHISDRQDWITMSSGGCIYAVAIFHASLTEYLPIFGNSIGTSGHTGRHRTEIYDFVIDGELWYFKEECPWKKIVYQAGDRYYLVSGKYLQMYLVAKIPFIRGISRSINKISGRSFFTRAIAVLPS